MNSVEVHEVDTDHMVAEIGEWLTPPRLALELHVARVNDELVAWWRVEDGRTLAAALVGTA